MRVPNALKEALDRLMSKPGAEAVFEALSAHVEEHGEHLKRRHDAVAAVAAAKEALEPKPDVTAELARLEAQEKETRERLHTIQRQRSDLAQKTMSARTTSLLVINRGETLLRGTCDERIRRLMDALRDEHRNFDRTWERLAVRETRGTGWECHAVILNKAELQAMQKALRDSLDALDRLSLVAEPTAEELEHAFSVARAALDAVRDGNPRSLVLS